MSLLAPLPHSPSCLYSKVRSNIESTCFDPCLWPAPCRPSQSTQPLPAIVPPRTLPSQLSWCVGSPSKKLDILKSSFENSALCLHQYGVVLLQFCASLVPEKQFLKPSDDKPGLPSWEQSIHAGPVVNNTFCSLCSRMWITIWLGTPVTPTKTGMACLPATWKQVGVWGQWELSELCAGSVSRLWMDRVPGRKWVHLCSRPLYLSESAT
jgi:hypothetical protein